MEWYEYSDRKVAELKRKAAKEFRRARLLLPFDEINSMSGNTTQFRVRPAAVAVNEIRVQIHKLYKRLDKLTRQCLEDIYEYIYWARLDEYGGDEKKARLDAKKRVEELLSAYNPVTKYVYDQEIKRKSDRLFEAIVADGASGKPTAPDADFKTAERLFDNMVDQYGVDTEDDATLYAMVAADVKRVMWITEHDERVCETCEKLDGLIFRIDRVPSKPHYNCRCTVKPWRGK